MTEEVGALLREARDSISAAAVLVESGYPGYAASRAYYAMFYIAEAFLYSDGMSFSTHAAVIAGFGQHFARAGRVPAEFHRMLIQAQELRLQGDYDPQHDVTPDEAREQIRRAERFLKSAEEFFGPG